MTVRQVSSAVVTGGLPTGSRTAVRPGPAVVASAVVAAMLLLAVLWPDLFAGGSPTDTDPLAAFQPPGADHWFGTDQLGRDVFARVVHGARYSLVMGAGATALSAVLAIAWGLAAALSGRAGDAVLMRVADVFLALPGLLVALLAVLIVGKGVLGATVAVAVGAAPGFARVVRAQALVVRRTGYVEAAVGMGIRRPLIVLRHVLPNTLGPLLVLVTVTLAVSISTAAALSYLGVGAQPPTPEWGAMLTEGQSYMQLAWWMVLFPGLMLVASVLAITVLGRHLQTGAHRRAHS